MKKTEPLESFASRLRAAMARKGATLQQVATACGVAISTVGAWTQAKNWPQVEVQPALAKYLETRLTFLIHGITEYQEDDGKKTGKVEEPVEPEPARGSSQRESQFIHRPSSPLAPGRVSATEKRRMEIAQRFAEIKEPTREQCLAYIAAYLERAEQVPGGIGHAWVELNKNFPLQQLEDVKEPQ